MTLNELLLIRAALNGGIHSKPLANYIIEREIKLKELEKTLNTKEGNETYGR